MKYKNNVAEKLTQLEATANRIQFQVNRNADQDSTLESIDDLKEQIEKIQEMISLEQDDFAQQFRGQ
jgi:peptidoglycan hydrolase CwlO-like protein